MLTIEVPKPSQYIKHTVVEEVATECNRLYRKLQRHDHGFPVDVLAFADLDLGITIDWGDIDEPECTTVFAKCGPDPIDVSRYIITINIRYRELFDLRPDLLRSCIAHEIGHVILRHFTWNARPTNIGLLFPDIQPEPCVLHDSAWKPHAFTKQEMDEWCRQASKGDEAARQKLRQLEDRLEPEWMFWQAECFSMCFLIPRDRLRELFDEGWGVSNWPAIYRLAHHFGVSPSMMKARLKKMGAITIEGGTIGLGQMFRQKGLLG
jgi:hypothetical protein